MKILKKSVIVLFLLLIICNINTMAAEENNLPSIISEYIEKVNEQNYLALCDYVKEQMAEEYRCVFSNELNIENKCGIMAISNADVYDFCQIDDINDILYENVNYDSYNSSYFLVRLDITVKEGSSSDFVDGINYWGFVIGNENGKEKIIDIYLFDEESCAMYFQPMTRGCDTPMSTTGDKWTMPSSIKVYITSIGTIKTVDFKTYCLNVTACEIGNMGYDINAIRAQSIAVKNYAWRRIMLPQKYSTQGYHVQDSTNDQVYNENIGQTTINNVRYGVDSVWDYFMLDNDYKLFPAFYLANVSNGANGGIMSQNGANSLANQSYSFEQILHYYYDRVSGVSYVNTEVALGTIRIININHTASYGSKYYYNSTGHWRICTVCNCMHVKTAHDFNSAKQCSLCGYIE